MIGEDIIVQRPPKLVVGYLQHGTIVGIRRRVADQDVDRTELLSGPRDQLLERILVTEVGGYHDGGSCPEPLVQVQSDFIA